MDGKEMRGVPPINFWIQCCKNECRANTNNHRQSCWFRQGFCILLPRSPSSLAGCGDDILLFALILSLHVLDRVMICDGYNRSYGLIFSLPCIFMHRMDQLPRNHIHAHIPLLRNIPPIISVITVFLLVASLILTNFNRRREHFTSLERTERGGMWDRLDFDSRGERDSPEAELSSSLDEYSSLRTRTSPGGITSTSACGCCEVTVLSLKWSKPNSSFCRQQNDDSSLP